MQDDQTNEPAPAEIPSEIKETAQMAGNEPLADQRPVSASSSDETRQENLNKANLKRQEKKREKIDKILGLFDGKNGSTSSPQVINDEVEKLLHVSDATATRYLETLEKEGKIKQIGKTGKAVSYSKV